MEVPHKARGTIEIYIQRHSMQWSTGLNRKQAQSTANLTLRRTSNVVSQFHGHIVHIGTYELRGSPPRPSCPPNHLPTFLNPPLGVGFRPYPMGVLHVTCANSSTLPLGSYGRHGGQKRTLYILPPLGIKPHPPTCQLLDSTPQRLGGNAIPMLVPHTGPTWS